MLPIIVIRRLDCVLIKWREDKAAEVLANRPKLSEKELAKLVKGLDTSAAPFSNKTDWTLRKVYEENPTLLEGNFRATIGQADLLIKAGAAGHSANKNGSDR